MSHASLGGMSQKIIFQFPARLLRAKFSFTGRRKAESEHDRYNNLLNTVQYCSLSNDPRSKFLPISHTTKPCVDSRDIFQDPRRFFPREPIRTTSQRSHREREEGNREHTGAPGNIFEMRTAKALLCTVNY